MKRFLLAGLCLLVASHSFAQDTTLIQKIRYFFDPLDKSEVQTGHLHDLTAGFTNPADFNGVLTDSNFTDINMFGMLYGETRCGQTATSGGLPSPSVYLSKIKALKFWPLLASGSIPANPCQAKNGPLFGVLANNHALVRPTTNHADSRLVMAKAWSPNL